MEFIENKKLEELDYPVGYHIDTNKKVIEIMVKEFTNISAFKGRKVNILCKGSSGAIVAAIFAMKLKNKCRIVHVKKEGEQSHSRAIHLWDRDDNPVNLIVDDFISSGDTINSIWARLFSMFPDFKIHCVAVTGSSRAGRLDFQPDYFICQERY